MRKTASIVKIAIASLGLFALSGCNTINGIGKDVQSAGKGISSGAETVRDNINGDDKKDEPAGGN